MNNYPIENQVCTLEQAKELTKLLEENAPESLWVWIDCSLSTIEENRFQSIKLRASLPAFMSREYIKTHGYWNAYTGDELGALLPTRLNYKMKSDEYSLGKNFSEAGIPKFHNGYLTIPNFRDFKSEYEAHAKADLAIQMLREGWIKPENFKY